MKLKKVLGLALSAMMAISAVVPWTGITASAEDVGTDPAANTSVETQGVEERILEKGVTINYIDKEEPTTRTITAKYVDETGGAIVANMKFDVEVAKTTDDWAYEYVISDDMKFFDGYTYKGFDVDGDTVTFKYEKNAVAPETRTITAKFVDETGGAIIANMKFDVEVAKTTDDWAYEYVISDDMKFFDGYTYKGFDVDGDTVTFKYEKNAVAPETRTITAKFVEVNEGPIIANMKFDVEVAKTTGDWAYEYVVSDDMKFFDGYTYKGFEVDGDTVTFKYEKNSGYKVITTKYVDENGYSIIANILFEVDVEADAGEWAYSYVVSDKMKFFDGYIYKGFEVDGDTVTFKYETKTPEVGRASYKVVGYYKTNIGGTSYTDEIILDEGTEKVGVEVTVDPYQYVEREDSSVYTFNESLSTITIEMEEGGRHIFTLYFERTVGEDPEDPTTPEEPEEDRPVYVPPVRDNTSSRDDNDDDTTIDDDDTPLAPGTGDGSNPGDATPGNPGDTGAVPGDPSEVIGDENVPQVEAPQTGRKIAGSVALLAGAAVVAVVTLKKRKDK